MARHKFFLVISAAYIVIGFFAFVMALAASFYSSFFENVWRAGFAFLLFAGAIHILFVAMRQRERPVYFLLSLFAFFEGVAAFWLVANQGSFAEISPAGNPVLSLIAIGIMLATNGVVMTRIEINVGRAPTYG
jgi:hypothetical protein